MRWKQFLTPVKSLDADQARNYMENRDSDELTILDVRQPNEYESGHISGSKLIPLPDLTERLHEIDPKKPTVVYCAIGGRSRIAAQMLAGNGFENVYNISGGFKTWKGEAAVGKEDLGLELFTGDESPEKTLVVAYSLEAGLRDFYASMIPRVKNKDAQNIFQKLSEIEVKHQDRIFNEYIRLSGKPVSREAFEENMVHTAVEGGLTTEEYTNLFQPDWESLSDIIELAMSIEAQALDLYLRAALRSPDPESRKVLVQIGDEERAHLKRLGKLMETLEG
ncbi:MAG: rhodanese-like domain-containing protein [Desulfobacteraceae bacterium]|nr:rhodanese-like domain-containing protein [Desulfobacteraceae bacterium]